MITKSNKFRAIRLGIGSAVGIATYAVVSAAVRNNTAEPETKTQKVTVALGSYAIAHMVAEKTSNWADRKLMTFVRAVDDANAKTQEQNATPTQ